MKLENYKKKLENIRKNVTGEIRTMIRSKAAVKQTEIMLQDIKYLL